LARKGRNRRNPNPKIWGKENRFDWRRRQEKRGVEEGKEWWEGGGSNGVPGVVKFIKKAVR
jgi:hypothetical protein